MSSRMKGKQALRKLRKSTAIPLGKEKQFKGLQMEKWTPSSTARKQRKSERLRKNKQKHLHR